MKGYPLNSSAIHISWKRIPSLPFKEKLLGYRIRFKSLKSLSYKEINDTWNVSTETVINGLIPDTEYGIEVNGFNKIGHGPASKTLELKTLLNGKLVRN